MDYNILKEIRDQLEEKVVDRGITSFYVGFLPDSPTNYLPAVFVYPESGGTRLEMESSTTGEDRYIYNAVVEVVIHRYSGAQESEDTNLELENQKNLLLIVNERDENKKPLENTVIGALREIIGGSNYHFYKDIRVDYDFTNQLGDSTIRAKIYIDNISKFNLR